MQRLCRGRQRPSTFAIASRTNGVPTAHLARVGSHEQHSAMAKADVRHLHCRRRALDHHGLMAPIKLIGLTRIEGQRHIGSGRCLLFLLGPDPSQSLALGLARVHCKHLVKLVFPGLNLRLWRAFRLRRPFGSYRLKPARSAQSPRSRGHGPRAPLLQPACRVHCGGRHPRVPRQFRHWAVEIPPHGRRGSGRVRADAHAKLWAGARFGAGQT